MRMSSCLAYATYVRVFLVASLIFSKPFVAVFYEAIVATCLLIVSMPFASMLGT